MPKFTLVECKKEFSSKWVFQQFPPWITGETGGPSVCTSSPCQGPWFLQSHTRGLGRSRGPETQRLLPQFCSSWGFAVMALCLLRLRSWAGRALAIASDFAFWEETLGECLRCDFVSPVRREQWKRKVQKLKKCLFLNWFLSKEVKREGNLNSCWKESSDIYFCNP